jgi:hypothetical protein
MQIHGDFDPNVTKTVVFSTPFRRKLFEPVEPPFNRPFGQKFLIPPPSPLIPQKTLIVPTVSPTGKTVFRISDVKAHLERALIARDATIHSDFVKQLTDYLSECWQERADAPPGGSDPDLPAIYN